MLVTYPKASWLVLESEVGMEEYLLAASSLEASEVGMEDCRLVVSLVLVSKVAMEEYRQVTWSVRV